MGLFRKDSQPPQEPQSQPARAPSPARQAPPSGRNVTLIAQAARVEGTLSGGADIHVEGEVEGTVSTKGRLVVAESGRVKAQLHGRIVTVAGRVTGNVTADERIELKETAHLTGDITAPRVLIREGATFDGKVKMKEPAAPGAAPDASPAARRNTK